jgi:DNA glycosylase AlkZ-like
MLAADRSSLKHMGSPGRPAVNLLPALDPYLMGYKERERYLDLREFDLVFDRSGNSTSTILIDGKAAGVWDFSQGPRPTVKLFLFYALEKKVLCMVESRARAVGQFMADKAVAVEMCDRMVPLPQRNAGGFMSPLGPSKGRALSD